MSTRETPARRKIRLAAEARGLVIEEMSWEPIGQSEPLVVCACGHEHHGASQECSCGDPRGRRNA